ncbi:protein of unknown function [Wenyingzhuangia marina]|uniref:Adhesin n=2 Tax=Wenyingzhuangia marina TaxID=1195760 RepID=A0A1M5TUZ3_9FLAO|nr:hypothetical protein GCM10011397_12300 [Wenyingzhuangia marina]SHH54597.1 protein of unknown function [Wenyingzhuangia marina]
MFTILLVSLTACQNQDWEFDDFEYQSVYFAYQYPVRTITLGEDVFDTSLDNEYKCKIYATLAGVYENDKDVSIDFSVADALTTGLLFNEGGDQITAMPSNYYNLLTNKIKIPKGELIGAIDVQLTDDFFADPLAIKNNYVIPVQMNNVMNADTILSGEPLFPGAKRGLDSEWSKAPKDFVFYAIKYINKWHGNYLRRGNDVIVGKNGNTALDEEIIRHKEYVEYDEVFKVNTKALNKSVFQLVFKDKTNNDANIYCDLVATFDDNGNCTISTESNTYTVSGTGKFIKDGEKNSWGDKDRDALYLDYEIDLANIHITSKDTLVMRDRAVSFETFTPVSQ